MIPQDLSADAHNVMRQAFAGLLWSKQFYHYVQEQWLERRSGATAAARPNASTDATLEWPHLYNADVISMPDKWEYPWYAAWDLAFHCVPLALIDADFAKEQLVLLLREWYMHPNGQTAGLRMGIQRRESPGSRVGCMASLQDRQKAPWSRRSCLPGARVPQTTAQLYLVGEPQRRRWQEHLSGWISRAAHNIGVFDRSTPLPTAGHLEQSDGTAGWRCTR